MGTIINYFKRFAGTILTTVTLLCAMWFVVFDEVKFRVDGNAVYEMSIMSTNSDDVDIHFIVGHGTVDAFGVQSAYIVKDNDVEFISDGYVCDIVGAADIRCEACTNLLNYMLRCDFNTVEDDGEDISYNIYGVECDRYLRTCVPSEYGVHEMLYYVDKDNVIRRVSGFADDLCISVSRIPNDEQPLNGNTVGIEQCLDLIYERFVIDNVFMYGKYDIVNDIIDDYNSVLGGRL